MAGKASRGEQGMDPITLIATAMTVGAQLDLEDSAPTVPSDAYARLRDLVVNTLAGQPFALEVLARHGRDPETWHVALMAVLQEAGNINVLDLTAAAQALLQVVDESTEEEAGSNITVVRGDVGQVAVGSGTIVIAGPAEGAIDMGGGGGGSPAGGTTDD